MMTDNTGDVCVPLLSDHAEEGDPKIEFIRNLHAEYLNKCHRDPHKGIHRDDFYTEMIPCRGRGGRVYWWLARDNPITVMIMENDYFPDGKVSCKFGNIVVFEEQVIETCLDSLVKFCRTYDLKILEEEE